MKKILTSRIDTLEDDILTTVYKNVLQSAICDLQDGLAVYLGEALSHQEITRELCVFFETILHKTDISKNVQLSEFVYEAMEIACGVKVSINGALDTKFVINCLILASALKGQSDHATETENTKFIQFVKEVLLQ